MSLPLIKINVETQEQIVKLYGIGPKLAERIVRYREEEGFFRQPEDLAKVSGLSLELAVSLSPLIDWEIPSPPEQPISRTWTLATLWMAVAVTVFYQTIYIRLTTLYQSIASHQDGIPVWIGVWRGSSRVISGAAFFLGLVALSASDLTTVSKREKRLFRLSIMCGGIGLLGSLLNGLGFMLQVQLYGSGKWMDYVKDPSTISGIIPIAFPLVLILPDILVLWRSKLRSNLILSRIYNFGIVIGAPSIALWIWANRNSLPLWILIFNGVLGAGFASLGVYVIRTGESFFDTNLLDSNVVKTINLSTWQTWLNTRLPDIAEQRALKKALDETYRPSRARSLTGLLVVGAGGWLLLTALSAIVQWVIDKGLDRVWK